MRQRGVFMVYTAVIATILLFTGVVLTVGVHVRCKRERTERYRAVGKAAEVTLPDSRNEYLRARLQTALAVSSEEYTAPDVSLLHAQKLSYLLSEKRLSGADSLIVRKLQKELGVFAAKEYFSVYEKGELSSLFSKLLTLCAKYEV